MPSLAHLKVKTMSPQLRVADIDQSIEFYTRNLGFDVDFRYQDFYASIIKDDYTIHFKSSQSIIKKRTEGESLDLDIVFSVENIEDLYQEISAKEVTIIQPLRRMPYGKEFYITDPDGNIIAFAEAS